MPHEDARALGRHAPIGLHEHCENDQNDPNPVNDPNASNDSNDVRHIKASRGCMCVPSGATSTVPTAPILRPSGSFAQPSTIRYGFGSPCADTVVAMPSANGPIRTTRTDRLTLIFFMMSPSWWIQTGIRFQVSGVVQDSGRHTRSKSAPPVINRVRRRAG